MACTSVPCLCSAEPGEPERTSTTPETSHQSCCWLALTSSRELKLILTSWKALKLTEKPWAGWFWRGVGDRSGMERDQTYATSTETARNALKQSKNLVIVITFTKHDVRSPRTNVRVDYHPRARVYHIGEGKVKENMVILGICQGH